MQVRDPAAAAGAQTHLQPCMAHWGAAGRRCCKLRARHHRRRRRRLCRCRHRHHAACIARRPQAARSQWARASQSKSTRASRGATQSAWTRCGCGRGCSVPEQPAAPLSPAAPEHYPCTIPPADERILYVHGQVCGGGGQVRGGAEGAHKLRHRGGERGAGPRGRGRLQRVGEPMDAGALATSSRHPPFSRRPASLKPSRRSISTCSASAA